MIGATMPPMPRDLRPTYAVAAGLLGAVIFSTTAQWAAHRFNAPTVGAPFGGCGAILTGFTVGAAIAFWPRRSPKPGSAPLIPFGAFEPPRPTRCPGRARGTSPNGAAHQCSGRPLRSTWRG